VIAVVACVGKYLFVGWLGFSFALRSVRQEYKDAAQVFGLSGWRQFSTITLPLIAPYIAGTGAVVFLLVLGEVDSLLLVSPPGFTTVPVRVYGLMHYGPSELVSSMAVLMVLVIGGIGMLGILARGE
jgi:ABC-type Fe3+ transport system permease subunit